MIRGIIFPTQDGVGSFSHSAGDPGQMRVQRPGVGEGQHEARSCGASGGQMAPKMQLHWYRVWHLALGLVPRLARMPVRVPCWPALGFAGKTVPRTDFWPGSLLEPYFQRLVLRPCVLRRCGDRRRYRPGEAFLNAVRACGSGFG